MEEIFIPRERVKALKEDKEGIEAIARGCNCRITVSDDNPVVAEGGGYEEYVARNVITAFGRGFPVKTALLLARDDYYFYTIDLDNVFKNKNRIKAVKGRLIGIEGKAIRYIGTVSSAKMCVYGDKISVIGKMEAVEEAEEAIKSIINGSKHGKAYSRMESVHRRHIDEKKAL
ncbi:MAG: hypothetical protein M1448_00690 [Candidatus Marsarchaeota archaeon]|jgi:ribosomal RNA assembly protein|nr:hypothetical protein [Candidatus Marsarchaeota archaeon]